MLPKYQRQISRKSFLFAQHQEFNQSVCCVGHSGDHVPYHWISSDKYNQLGLFCVEYCQFCIHCKRRQQIFNEQAFKRHCEHYQKLQRLYLAYQHSFHRHCWRECLTRSGELNRSVIQSLSACDLRQFRHHRPSNVVLSK
jgi:hypothetical protein